MTARLDSRPGPRIAAKGWQLQSIARKRSPRPCGRNWSHPRCRPAARPLTCAHRHPHRGKGENHEPYRIQILGRHSGGCHRICARWPSRGGKHKEQNRTGSGKIAWRKGAVSCARGGHTQPAAAIENPPGEANDRIGKPRAHGTANRPRPYRNDRYVMMLASPFCPIEQPQVSDNHV